MRELLSTLVEKHFPDSIRTCSQYFSLLLEYANMVRTGPIEYANMVRTGPRLDS